MKSLLVYFHLNHIFELLRLATNNNGRAEQERKEI